MAFLAAVSPCRADTNLFDAGTSWNLPGDWSLGHVPTASDALEFNGPASTTLENSFGAQTLSFDTGSSAVNTDANALGTGDTTARSLTLSGGTNALGTTDLIATSSTTTGTITFGGAAGRGTLNVALGTNGTFNVSNASANLVFGANATLSGADSLTKAGAGTLILGGANTYTGLTTVSAGTLTFAAGSSLAANNGGLLVSSGATLNVNGSVAIQYNPLDIYGSSNSASPTTVNLTAGATLTTFSTAVARNGGTAVLNQTGGAHNTGVLYIGSSPATTGTYLLSGGTVTTASFQDGRQGTGTFSQSGGAVVVPADANSTNPTFLVGSSGGNGTYLLSGGTLSTDVAGVGYAGTGAFVQSGGTHTASSEVLVGSSYDSNHPGTGTYTLTGGTLRTPVVSGGIGTSTFNFNGGTLVATASDNPGAASNPTTFISGLTTANVQAGGALINNNGFNVTVAQPLLHDPSLGSAVDAGLFKTGDGTLRLTASNTYTGKTDSFGGTLLLDFSASGAPASNIVPAGSRLLLDGSTFAVRGSDSAGVNTIQTLGGLLLSARDSAIAVTSGGGGTTSLSLGAISRSANTSVDFTVPASGNITTSSGTGGAILSASGVAYATVGGSDWAAKDATNTHVVGGSTLPGFYTPSTAASLSGNADVAAGVTTTSLPTGATTLTSLRFNQAQATTINVGSGNTLTTGGILETAAVGNQLAQINGGTLRGASGQDLVILLNNPAGTLQIGSVIADNGSATGLTKSGAGTVTLTGASTFTGFSSVNGGTLNILGAITPGILSVDGTSANPALATLAAGGSLSARLEIFVGREQSGSFVQNGGAASTGELLVGDVGGSSGSYVLGGGTLSSSYAYVGNTGRGTFTQTGGTNTVTNQLTLGAYGSGIAATSGTYTLTGGTLQTPSVVGGTGTSTFNFNGGTLRATANDNPAAVGNPTTFVAGLNTANVQAGGARIDTNSFNVTVAQGLLHAPALGTASDGGLIKLGTGTLTLSGTNTFTGGTLLSAGTLAVANSSGLGTGNVTVAAGGQLTLNAGVAITSMFGTTLTLNSATTSTVNLLGTGVQDTVSSLVINGVPQLPGTYGAAGSGATFNLPDFLGTGELQVNAVPEPSSWTLLGLGVAGLFGLTLRRRRCARLG